MTTSTREQRHYSRIPFQTQVRLVGLPGIAEAALVDLSLKGALVAKPAQWDVQVGTTLDMELVLAEEAGLRIHMHTRVAYVRDGHMGLHCLHIDLDSVTQLRRLVAVNLGDPSLLDRELASIG